MSPRTALLAISSITKNLFSKKILFLVSEPASWAIYEDCRNIQRNLKGVIDAEITYVPFGLKNKIIHFASENTFLARDHFRDQRWYEKIHPSNKIVLTWFHISEQDSSRLHLIPLLNDRVDLVHTASQNTKRKLIEYGLKEDKIVVVPLGVDFQLFHSVTAEEKIAIRKDLEIPDNRFVIGSFQKDGVGWGEGFEPKLIKGPDIFCNIVERLSQKHPLHVLLTGPARGYVKKRLEKAKVPYTHVFLKKYEDIARYYQALDLYLITSREEGGPKALLEALASGIPLIATEVGMVPEVLKDGENGFTVGVGDENTIFAKASLLIEDIDFLMRIRKNSLNSIHSRSLRRETEKLNEKIYIPLLKQL